MDRAPHEEPLAAGVAIDALSDAYRGHLVGNAEFTQHLAHRGHLALTAIDEDEVRPCGEGVVVALLRSALGLRGLIG
jgi:hypothetical protein